MLFSLKKTLLNDKSASKRNFLSKSMNVTEGAGQSGEGKRGGGEEKEETTCQAKGRIKETLAAPSSSEPYTGG